MKVIKRDGRAVEYDRAKIQIAIEKANKEVTQENRATEKEITITGVTESAIKTGATYEVKMERNSTTALIDKITVSASSSNSTT